MSTSRQRGIWLQRARVLMAAAWLLSACAVAASAASIDPSVIDNPRTVVLDRNSSNRWQSLFEPNPRWVGRQIAYLESHQPDQILSMLVARLLYRGEPWTRRNNDLPSLQQWKRANLEVRAAILRALRNHRETVLADYLCQYLAYEDDPGLVTSALVDLYLIDPLSTPIWAIRLADPLNPIHLPGSVRPSVRQRCLSFLAQTSGMDSQETHAALSWALLRATGTERNHGISALPRGAAQDLLTAAVLRLVEEFRQGILDDEGKFGLVLAITRLAGNADRELVAALMGLAVHADRAVATSAASALATSLSWDTPVAINDLAARAQRDPDPVVRQSLLAFLMRLYPSAIAASAGQGSPWAELAHHQERLEQWELERAAK